jgi:hypothetical protein
MRASMSSKDNRQTKSIKRATGAKALAVVSTHCVTFLSALEDISDSDFHPVFHSGLFISDSRSSVGKSGQVTSTRGSSMNQKMFSSNATSACT